MRRVSSSWTFFYKRIFPVIWFGFLVLFVGVSLFTRQRSPAFLIVPLIMMGIGYFMMKKLMFDLVDEVWDDGHALVVKNGGRDERIAFTDIKNVNYSPFVNPPRVTLSLRRQTSFGDQITFCAPVRFIPLTTSPVVTALTIASTRSGASACSPTGRKPNGCGSMPSRQLLDQIVQLVETAVADAQRAVIIMMIDADD